MKKPTKYKKRQRPNLQVGLTSHWFVMSRLYKHRAACISGSLAAVSSAAGKATFKALERAGSEHWAARGGVAALGLAALAALNGAMLSFFLVAMQESGSARATVLNATVNFALSGALGFLLYGEELNSTWLLGSTLMLCGVVLLAPRDAVARPHPSSHGENEKGGKND